MDSYPYNTQPSNFVDLLNSQQDVVFGEDSVQVSSSQVPLFGTPLSEDSNIGETPAERRERRTWTPTEDQVLISAWLNTSKDSVVSNEQRSGAFWKRIAAYFAASPKIPVSEQREWGQCKQRWHKINDVVGKFCGAFEAASRERSSGQNDTDVLKLAHEIFFNAYNKKFTMEHAWKELRNDQKWCELSSSKTDKSCKRRKLDDSVQSSTSHASETKTDRPPGVKAAKAHGKKTKADERLSELESVWSMKNELSKMKLLDRLLAKVEPLAEYEEDLKKKLISELFSN